MALTPLNDAHRGQIEAGTAGRRQGHGFERSLASQISAGLHGDVPSGPPGHIYTGSPAQLLVEYIARSHGISHVTRTEAWWLGGLATAGAGDRLVVDGDVVRRSKSDVLVRIHAGSRSIQCGASVKTCSKATPTNAQLYFSTATAFSRLMRARGVPFPEEAELGLRHFCGDLGFRPTDRPAALVGRRADPDRWFFEELPTAERAALEGVLTRHQDRVTEVLLREAYDDDPCPPEYVMHQTGACRDLLTCEVALFSVAELVAASRRHCGFETRPYQVRKGRFKGDPAIHLAPRFGFVQFQRGGQAQHPTQLQFNLKAGYFRHI